MSARDLKKLLRPALKEAQAEIKANWDRGGLYARGSSNEGYAGGYAAALMDVEAVLYGTPPSDPRGYWRRAFAALPTPNTEPASG